MNRFLFFFFISLSLGFFWTCKSETKLPDGIPQGAYFDKKRNLYTSTFSGIRKQYTDKGQLYSECEIDSQGREQGVCKTYLPETGVLLSTGRFRAGERDGVWTWNFPDGKIYYKQSFAHDKKRKAWMETNLLGNEHGEYFRYYPNGQLEEQGFYDTGLKTGEWKKFYPSGNPESMGSFQKDKRIGNWKFFYPDGTLEARESYDKEAKLLERETFHPDGKRSCLIKANSSLDCDS
jgi:antitoxin component YwqK of YwqJK toxin-antitoxin module